MRGVVPLLGLGLVACHEPGAVAGLRSLDDADCVACHADAAASWAPSRHHASFTNPDFQRSYGREPKPFCRDCHAPATVRGALPDAEARGVSCVDCHGGGDGVVHASTGASFGPHPLARRDDFGTTSCAGCHQFAFPASSRRPTGTLMQSTVDEHAASRHAGRTCASCHLAGGDHSLASTRDPQAWRDALAVRSQRVADGVALELKPRGVGHALPTGDLFRRLALHVEARVEGAVVAEHTRYLARHFEPWRHADGTLNAAHAWPVRDDRLRDATTVVLPLPTLPEAAEVSWRVDYERVDARNDRDPAASSIAGRITLASGVSP